MSMLYFTFYEKSCKLTLTRFPPAHPPLHLLGCIILSSQFSPLTSANPRPLTPGKFTLSTLTIFFLFSALYAWWITISHYHSHCLRPKNNNLNSRELTCASRLRVSRVGGELGGSPLDCFWCGFIILLNFVFSKTHLKKST